MGTSAAPVSGLPPLPPGATLNAAPSPSAASSGGLPPLPPGATLNSDASQSPSAANPMPAAQPASHGLTDNSKGEGTYAMVGNDGQVQQIPYSNVQTAASQGARFQTRGELQQYARDHAADPVSEDAADRYIDSLSWYNPVRLARDSLAGFGTGAAKLATGLDRAPQSHGIGGRIEQDAQLAAATPTKGFVQGANEAAENVGEWFTGEELLGMLGKAGEAMTLPEKLKSVTGLAQTIEKYPIVGKLLKIGSSAVKQGTIGGVQTYAKTGDAGAGAKAAGITAALTPAAEFAASRIAASRTATAPLAADERYAGEARGIVEPYLREAQDAIERQGEFFEKNPTAATGTPTVPEGVYDATRRPTPHQPHSAADLLGGNASGLPEAGNTDLAPRNQIGSTRTQPSVEFDEQRGLLGGQGQTAATFDVDNLLNSIHDMNGAKDRLVQVAGPMYDVIDHVTNGQFRTLNEQVSAAQKAVYKSMAGTPEREAAENLYANRQQQMDKLIDSTRGTVSPQILSAAKSAFRQSYLLDDFATIWDRNLEGVPGNTKASSAQRGVNGKGLMRDLTNAVNKKGRPFIEKTLGPGRLDNLEEIARANETIPKKIAFAEAVRNVARNMAHGAIVGGIAGETLGGGYKAGAALGAATVGATYIPDVLKAVSTNPRIGKFLLSAISMGATPEVYGPMIAKMIQESADQTEKPEGKTGKAAPAGDGKRLDAVAPVASETATPAAPASANVPATVQGLRAIDTLPAPIQRVAHEVNPQFVQGPPRTNDAGQPITTNVVQGSSAPNTIEINNAQDFENHIRQYTGHELTHNWQNNLPPSVQAAIPPDATDGSQFDISDVDKLRKEGKTMVSIPREKAATIVETYIAQPSQRARLQPWIDDMGRTPLSSTMPTTDKDKGLNMTPRAPGLPGPEVAGMSEPTHRRKGRR